jgi:hypothetical protein
MSDPAAPLYRQRIYCLHGPTGNLTADVGAAATVLPVQAAVTADVTIAPGSRIELDDGTNTSVHMTVVGVDAGAGTITVDVGPGAPFAAASPTVVRRLEHWAFRWTEDETPLTQCPELASHPVRAGSASWIERRASDYVQISQGPHTEPKALGEVLTAAAGTSDTVTWNWPYDVSFLSLVAMTDATNPGDALEILIGPEFQAGTLATFSSAGSSTFDLSDEAIAEATPAECITINTEDLGEILSVDKAAKTVTTSGTSAVAHSAGDPVYLTTKVTHGPPGALGAPLPSFQTSVDLGSDYLSSNPLPAGRDFRLALHSAGPAASRVTIWVRYLT